MRRVTYSMSASLDGYIVGPDGSFQWTAPDKDVFRFWIDEIREVGVHLMGRRLYETMLYWETADQEHSLDDAELEWAALWNPLPNWSRSARPPRPIRAHRPARSTACTASPRLDARETIGRPVGA